MKPKASGSRLPHFIIIGAMKAATSTLQEQLARQPGIFMSDPKEPNFFSDDDQYSKGLAWYEELFAGAHDGDLRGEASTHYTKLPTHPKSLERMCERLPYVRLVYVMRHPVDRLVSHYIHEWSMGNIHCGIDEAVSKHPEMIAYGQYATQIEPFLAAYGRDAVLPVFFDRLTHEPQTELERVCHFIGYEGNPKWQMDIEPSNVSSQRLRRFPLYGLVVKSTMATRLRRALIPQGLRDWVKTKLTMRQRPVLSQEIRSALESEFDGDLARLGGWLGAPLSCKKFKQLTGSRELNWIAYHG